MPLKTVPSNGTPPSFDEAIVSLKGYPSLDQVPRVLFRRLNQIITLEGKSIDEACDAIAMMIGINRKAIQEKLEAFPSTYNRWQEGRRTS